MSKVNNSLKDIKKDCNKNDSIFYIFIMIVIFDNIIIVVIFNNLQ